METIQINNERPATCFCCKKQLYFIGDSRHEPEYELIIKDHLKSSTLSTTYFVHVSCWFFVLTFIKHFCWANDEEESN